MSNCKNTGSEAVTTTTDSTLFQSHVATGAVEQSDEPKELKAKQIMGEYQGRLTMIERMNARLRPLRPPVCTSRRLFDYFELPDPYHPLDFNKPYKQEVGPSKLVLGENRRPVAPHAKVPPLKPRIGEEKKQAPQAFRPQGIPSAPTRETKTPDPIASRVAPKPGQKPEFGPSKGHAVTKLPVRPDLAQQQATDTDKSKPQMQRSLPPVSRSIPRPNPQTLKSKTGNMRMRRSTVSNKPVVKSLQPTPKPIPESSTEPTPVINNRAVNRSPSAASADGGLDDLFGFGNQEGRMKIPRASKTVSSPQKQSTPVATQPIPPKTPKPEPVRELPKVQPPPQPINRSPSAASGGGGLDDLFGFGNQEGRMKIPRAAKKTESAPSSRPIFDKNPVAKPTDGKK